MEDYNYDNEIIELDQEVKEEAPVENLFQEEKIEPIKVEINNNEKKPKKRLSKKAKIIIIVLVSLLVAGLIGVALFFVLKDEEPQEPEPIVIVEKDNYRFENGSLVFLNSDDKEIGEYKCTNDDSEKCYVTKIDLKEDLFDRIKNVNEKNEEIIKTSKIYNNKFVFITDGEETYLYNIELEKVELELNGIKVYDTKDDIVVVINENNLYGLLKLNKEDYEYLIRPSYNYLGIVNLEKKLLVAKDKDKQYIIDSTGKTLSKNIKVEIRSANETFIVGYVNDTYNLYDYEYEELLSEYNYISLHDEVVALVSNKRLSLVDYELNKLYEDSIRLTNTHYNKKYVYDAENRLKETLVSYEIEGQNNKVVISIDDNDKVINMLEGKLSSELAYVSYFGGKLYFYSDEEKTDILGTYKCKSELVITDETSLDLCNVYKNDEGLISGIYNNEYVIIRDGSDSINSYVYYLYSLKESKVKGTYLDIEVLDKDELGEKIEPIYTSSSFIKAQTAIGSNKGNYGILEITSSKVSGKIPFNYKKITQEKGIYKFENTDGSIVLYDKEFEKISNEFSSVYLYDNYYVGVNNKKLNVFTYTSTEEILDNGISFDDSKDNKFTIDFVNGFTITIGEKTYKYDKTGKEIKEELGGDSDEQTGNEE